MQRLGREWTENQRVLWDGFSEDFRDHFEPWTLPSAEQLAGDLRLEAGSRVLEVGCGAGGAGALFSSRLPAGTTWTALDLSPAMVALAREALGPGARVIQGSAESLPFEDDSFDRLVSCLCLMLVADPTRALAEAHRVLSPGGLAGWTVWGRPAHSPMMTLVGRACDSLGIEQVMLERNNFHLGDAVDLEGLVRDAGFSEIQSAYRPMVLDVADGNDFAHKMLYTGERRLAWLASLGTAVESALVAEVSGLANATLKRGESLALDVLSLVAKA